MREGACIALVAGSKAKAITQDILERYKRSLLLLTAALAGILRKTPRNIQAGMSLS
ncbi:MAG TPA: hypothetical protein V6C93_32275 [Allocoleopsis sp.]